MAERLTDEELNELEDARGCWFVSDIDDSLMKLLTEVRERRAETYSPLARLRDIVDNRLGMQPVLEFEELLSLVERQLFADRMRIAQLEAALRESSADLGRGLFALGFDTAVAMESGSAEARRALRVAAQEMVDRARAALKGGG